MRCANIRIHAEIPVITDVSGDEAAGRLDFRDCNDVAYSVEAIQEACAGASNLPIIQYDEQGEKKVVGAAHSIKWNPLGFIEVDGLMRFGGTCETVEFGKDNRVSSMEFSEVGLGG